MSRVLQWIGSHFSWFFFASMVGALLLPVSQSWLNELVLPMLMFVIFLSLLNVKIEEVMSYIRKPKLLLALLFLSLVLVPVASFYTFAWLNFEWAVAFLVLGAMPAGMSAAALTHLFKGKVALAVPLTVVGHILLPFSLVGLIGLLAQTELQLPLLQMFIQLCLVIFIPLLASEFVKWLAPKMVEKVRPNVSGIIVILICIFVYIVMSPQSEMIGENPILSVKLTLVLFVYFAVMHFVGWVVPFKMNRKERIASCVSMAYMNNGLAIVLAFEWFGPEVVLICVLSELAWMGSPILFHRLLPRLS